MATVWIPYWGDHYCATCYENISSLKAYAELEKEDINVNPTGSISGG